MAGSQKQRTRLIRSREAPEVYKQAKAFTVRPVTCPNAPMCGIDCSRVSYGIINLADPVLVTHDRQQCQMELSISEVKEIGTTDQNATSSKL